MTVFILGAGPMQVPAIDCAREMGWTVACADGNPAASGARRADRFFPVDLKDLEGLEAAARELRAASGLDAVFTAGTDFSVAVAWLAERLGLPGHPLPAARRASDKLAMRAAFAAAGLPSPRFVAIGPGEEPVAAVTAADLAFPLVVKPQDSMGARGCRAVHDLAELERAVAGALPFSRGGRAIVEEYLEGPEFSLDALVVDGDVRIRGIADRHIAFAPYFVELGHTMPTDASPTVVAAVVAVFRAGIEALGLVHGAAKGDIKWCPGKGGAMIGEIAARLSGGYMSGWTYPYASGLEPTREALLLAAGLDPGEAPPDRGWCSAERAFISIPGTCAVLAGIREASTAPFIKELIPRVERGQALVFPRNNVEKAGSLISQAPDRECTVHAAETAIRGILVRLLPDDPATEAFLRGEGVETAPDGSTWPPPAFTPSPALAALLAAMPDRVSASPRQASVQGLTVMDTAMSSGSAAPIEVLGFPAADNIEGKDWAGRGYIESARLALTLGGGSLVAESGRQELVGKGFLAGRFWRALQCGGAQAALYVLDCERGARQAG